MTYPVAVFIPPLYFLTKKKWLSIRGLVISTGSLVLLGYDGRAYPSITDFVGFVRCRCRLGFTEGVDARARHNYCGEKMASKMAETLR